METFPFSPFYFPLSSVFLPCHVGGKTVLDSLNGHLQSNLKSHERKCNGSLEKSLLVYFTSLKHILQSRSFI